MQPSFGKFCSRYEMKYEGKGIANCVEALSQDDVCITCEKLERVTSSFVSEKSLSIRLKPTFHLHQDR